jgi:hypothetical protein
MKKFLTMVLCLLVLSGCGGAGIDPPKWYGTAEEDDAGYLYIGGTGRDDTLESATMLAETDARTRLTRAVQSRMTSMVRRMIEESGTTENSDEVEQLLSSVQGLSDLDLYDTPPTNSDFQYHDDLWHAFIQVRSPPGQGAALLSDLMDREAGEYARLRATKAYQEMERQVKELRRWREEQEN